MSTRSGRISPFDVFNIALVVGIVGLLGFAFLMVPAGGGPPPHNACLSNIRQNQLSLIMYAADNDDLTPERDHWMDAALTYSKNPAILNCPWVRDQEMQGYGYAFNSSLGSKNIVKMADAATTPMLYDSINYARNASDPFISLPPEGRHKGKNAIGYADGHTASKAAK